MNTGRAAGRPVAAYLKLLDLGVPPMEEVERRLLLARDFASKFSSVLTLASSA